MLVLALHLRHSIHFGHHDNFACTVVGRICYFPVHQRLARLSRAAHQEDTTAHGYPIFTLTTAAGLSLAARPSGRCGSGERQPGHREHGHPGPDDLLTEAATTAAASIVPEAADAAGRPAATRAREPAPSVTGGVNADLLSHYVWRGFALTDGFAFQPTVLGSSKGLTFTSWSSWSSTDAGCFDPDDCPALLSTTSPSTTPRASGRRRCRSATSTTCSRPTPVDARRPTPSAPPTSSTSA